MKRKIKVLMVDDHPMVRTGIKLMLNQQKSFEANVDEAEDGQQAIDMAVNDYDIILLDVNIPRVDGVSVIRHLKSNNISTPILAISMHNEVHIVKQVVEAGAHGYLIKNCGIEELTKAIDTVINYKNYYCNEAAQALLSKTSRKVTDASVKSTLLSVLTEREKQVLRELTNQKTNQQIAEKLNISKRTVEGHRMNMIKKTRMKNIAGLIRYAVENGIV